MAAEVTGPKKNNRTLMIVLVAFAVIGGGGCLVCAGLGGATYFVGKTAVETISPFYTQALTRVTADPRVREAIGEEVAPDGLPSSSIKSNAQEQKIASMRVPLKGARGSGELILEAVESDAKTWRFKTLQVALADGRVIDLLAGAEAAAPRAPEGAQPSETAPVDAP